MSTPTITHPVNDELVIVQASHENFERLLPLVAEYQQFYRCEPDEARNCEFFGQFLNSQERGVQFLGLHRDEAIGFATLYFVYSSSKATEVAVLNDLYVRPGHRGGRDRGFAGALMWHALTYGFARGYRAGQGETERSNLRGQGLYDAMLDSFLEHAGPAVNGDAIVSKTDWCHYFVQGGDGRRVPAAA